MLLLDTTGNVWTCGGNRFGQLGLGDTGQVPTPMLVSAPMMKPIIATFSLPVQAALASDAAPHGKLCYDACIKRLTQEQDITLRLHYALLLEDSLWKKPLQQRELIAPLLLLSDSRQQLLVAQLNKGVKSEPTMIIRVFSALLRLYDYIAQQHATSHGAPDDDQRACQKDFVALLSKLSRKEIKTIDALNTYCQETAKTSQFIQRTIGIGFFSGAVSPPSTSYFGLRQKLVEDIVRQPSLFVDLPTAASLLLHSVECSAETDNLATQLKNLVPKITDTTTPITRRPS